MNPWLTLIAGLIVGAVVAWLWAKARAETHLSASRIAAEGRIKGAEGTIAELRAQVQEMPSLRERIQVEEKARVTAETRLQQAEVNLAEQHRLLNDAET